jgi:tRNA U38,U39,U40 pseudouridine synthase TruA
MVDTFEGIGKEIDPKAAGKGKGKGTCSTTTETERPPPTKGITTLCQACQRSFPSKNAMFTHLIQNKNNCLSAEDHAFVAAQNLKTEKIAVLYGYQPASKYRHAKEIVQVVPEEGDSSNKHKEATVGHGHDTFLSVKSSKVNFCMDAGSVREAAKMGAFETPVPESKKDDQDDAEEEEERMFREVTGGETAAKFIMEAISLAVSQSTNNGAEGAIPIPSSVPNAKTNRSFGCNCRNTAIIAQEDFTPAVTEMLTIKAPALLADDTNDEEDDSPAPDTTATGDDTVGANASEQKSSLRQDAMERATAEWVNKINDLLRTMLQPLDQENTDRGQIRVFGRLTVPKRFNAEMDVTSRRVEYLLPIDFVSNLFASNYKKCPPSLSTTATANEHQSQSPEAANTLVVANEEPSLQQMSDLFPTFAVGAFDKRPQQCTLNFLYETKKLMQSLSSHIEELDPTDAAAVLAKEFSSKKREKRQRMKQQQQNEQRDNDKKQKKKKQETPSSNGDGDSPGTGIATLDENGQALPQTNIPEQGAMPSPIPGGCTTSKEANGTSEKSQKGDKNGRPAHAHREKNNDKSSSSSPQPKKKDKKEKKVHVLRRKRYHNFTPSVMAHEFLAFRRMDRFHHRSTSRFVSLADTSSSAPAGDVIDIDNRVGSKQDVLSLLSSFNDDVIVGGRPYLSLNLSGDMFLTGQAQGVVGLFIAVCKGVIDKEIIDCIFDENYPTLVPAPVAPYIGLYAKEANYMSWEGRLRAILNPRHVGSAEQRDWTGFRSKSLLNELDTFQQAIQTNIAMAWMEEGVNSQTGRLYADEHWTEYVLKPWAIKANEQLADYRQWRASRNVAADGGEGRGQQDVAPVPSTMPSLTQVDDAIPALFENTLRLLREADSSCKWPTTSPKRQLVMVSTSTDPKSDGTQSLVVSYSNTKVVRSKEERAAESAYSYEEGQGGASGSFSVGAMPGGACEQPRGNLLFPELMKAAFELEIALCPDREPSSTIAINRNAQFRPHTDSGAGAGQSTSLIVGLGHYAGGEIMVEGDKQDIRYTPLEFDGWTQRHWTLPFVGERYSLVWFTPHGCEGKHGIDLCSSG